MYSTLSSQGQWKIANALLEKKVNKREKHKYHPKSITDLEA